MLRPERPVSAGTPASSGFAQVPVSVGAASVTVTLKVPDELLPVASVAVQVTVVVPRSKAEPLGGVQPTVGAGSTSSVAVGSVQVTTVLAPVVVVAMSPGRPWISGAVVSTGGSGTTTSR